MRLSASRKNVSKFEKINKFIMSTAEMKIEAINKITSVNDEFTLKEVLKLLKEADEAEEELFKLSSHYEAIKEQYGDVLQKLAQ